MVRPWTWFNMWQSCIQYHAIEIPNPALYSLGKLDVLMHDSEGLEPSRNLDVDP
jgi:hypothetical protein